MIFDNSLLVFEDQLRERSWWQVFLEILRKKIFDPYPIHRYRGRVTLEGDTLHINMRHVRTSEPLELHVSLRDIVGLDIGFDNVFAFFMDPMMISWRMGPLCVSYTDRNGMITTIYLYADFDHGLMVNRHSRNNDLFAELSDRIMQTKAHEG